METSDADYGPDSSAWQALDEEERIELVVAYHRRHHRRTPLVRLHATLHAIVENQLAAGEPVVVETLKRLRREGLCRHDAVQAVGSVLPAEVDDMLKREDGAAPIDPNDAYAAALRTLNVETRRNAGSPRAAADSACGRE